MSKKKQIQRTLSDELNEVMSVSKNDEASKKESGISNLTNNKQEYGDETAIQPLIPQMRKNQSHRQNDQQAATSLTNNLHIKNWQASGQNKVANMSYKSKKNYTELTEIEKRKYDIQIAQEEKVKSELKIIQIQLDQIQDKNSDEYKKVLQIALQQLIFLIKMQPDRMTGKKNDSKKPAKINEEDQFLKDGVEIDWIKDKGSSSLIKSKKGLLSNAINFGEKYAKQGLNLVEEAFLNEIDSKDLALKREEERQDDVWQKIIQRTCRTQVILDEL